MPAPGATLAGWIALASAVLYVGIPVALRMLPVRRTEP
jgi:hypothetical protein